MVAAIKRRTLFWERPRFLVLVASVVILIGFGPGLLFLTDTPALRYLNVPFPLEHRTLHPGDVVLAYTERCNRLDRNAPYHYVRKISAIGGDARANVLIEGQGFAPPGCAYTWVPLVTLPTTLPPGAYYLEALNIVNGQFRTFEITWRTESFTVVAP